MTRSIASRRRAGADRARRRTAAQCGCRRATTRCGCIRRRQLSCPSRCGPSPPSARFPPGMRVRGLWRRSGLPWPQQAWCGGLAPAPRAAEPARHRRRSSPTRPATATRTTCGWRAPTAAALTGSAEGDAPLLSPDGVHIAARALRRLRAGARGPRRAHEPCRCSTCARRMSNSRRGLPTAATWRWPAQHGDPSSDLPGGQSPSSTPEPARSAPSATGTRAGSASPRQARSGSCSASAGARPAVSPGRSTSSA